MLAHLSMLLVSLGCIIGLKLSKRPLRSHSLRMVQQSHATLPDKPLTELCEITKQACEAVAPMLQGEYYL